MAKSKSAELKLPSPHDWRTTDSDEINKRRQRARDETFTISNADPRHPIFSNFRVASRSGLNYSVEIRDVRRRQFACDCVDFRINGLGTCKHVEAVLLLLERRFKRLFQAASQKGSDRVDLVPDVALGFRVVKDRQPRDEDRGGQGGPAALRQCIGLQQSLQRLAVVRHKRSLAL